MSPLSRMATFLSSFNLKQTESQAVFLAGGCKQRAKHGASRRATEEDDEVDEKIWLYKANMGSRRSGNPK